MSTVVQLSKWLINWQYSYVKNADEMLRMLVKLLLPMNTPNMLTALKSFQPLVNVGHICT